MIFDKSVERAKTNEKRDFHEMENGELFKANFLWRKLMKNDKNDKEDVFSEEGFIR